MSFRLLRTALVIALVTVVLIGGLLWLNLSRLTTKLAQETIPGLTIGNVQVAWNRVKLADFRYVSGSSLVANLAARSVDAHPTFLSFLQKEIEVRKLVIKSPEFHLIRRQQEVEPRATPGTSSAPAGAPPPPQSRANFKQVTLLSGRGDIEDQTVSGAPARLALEQIDVILSNFRYPALAGATDVDATCLVKGQPDGKAHLSGWLDSVNQSADLRLDASSIDLKNLRPYLRDRARSIENADGTADVRLALVMMNGAYTANGELTLADLRLPASEQKPGLANLLLTQYLKLHHNRVTVPFKITGDVRKKEHRLDLSALLSGLVNQEIGNEALQKKIGLPKSPEKLDQELRNLKEKLRKIF